VTSKHALKQVLRSALASRWLRWLYAPVVGRGLCVFTLHRFGSPRTAMAGMSLDLLDEILSRLEHEGYRYLDLGDAVGRISRGARLPHRSVAFTVDDGYADFELAAAVFRRHSCPVTVFLTTGFIDRSAWQWWDEVEYCCLEAAPGEYSVEGAQQVLALPAGPEARIPLIQELWKQCKRLEDPDMRRFVRALREATGCSLPSPPPATYAPMSWDKIRALESDGARFAPHTVTHPILSRADDQQAEREISESWRRVRDELRDPVPIFAYPNGEPGDFGEREFRILEAAGLEGAVTTLRGSITVSSYRNTPHGRFELPRVGAPSDAIGACLTASGFDSLPRPWR